MSKLAPAIVFVLALHCFHNATGAVFSYQTQIISPPITTSPTPGGGAFTGHLFLSDTNHYIFEFLPYSSTTKEQGSSIRIANEGSDFWDTRGHLTMADNDSISMVDFEFEIEIIDEPTGKTFPFTMSGNLSGTVSFFDSNGQPFDGCTDDCYMADYVSSVGFDSTSGGSVTMGNVVYQLSPTREIVGIGASSAGVESFLDFGVSRVEYQAGDFNHDNSVTIQDYSYWRAAFGQTGLGLWADGNCSGEVDAADYVLWRRSFQLGGASQLDGKVEVCEPSTGVLLLVCLSTPGIASWGRARRA